VAYSDIALLAEDFDFKQRVAAAYATETLDDSSHEIAPRWAQDHAWETAAQPGFGDAYASALAGNVERPGNDPSVISDEQILAAVQAIMGAEGGGE